MRHYTKQRHDAKQRHDTKTSHDTTPGRDHAIRILRIITWVVGLLLPFLILSREPITAQASNTGGIGEDWVRIVALSPNHYDNYTDPVEFTATIDYSLYSQDQGIIYLGFNTDRADYYEVDEVETDHIVVNKGVGRVVLSKTVVPKNWNSGASFALQFVNGNYNLVKDFKVYANISPYPHDVPWTPLAIDEHVVTEMPETEQKVEIEYGAPDEKDEEKLGREVFDCGLEDLLKKTSSTEYDPQFAHLLIALCNAVHNEKAMKDSFYSLGFTDYEVDLKLDDAILGYGLAKKKLENGDTLVLVVGRGTEDVNEWLSNIDVQTPNGLHEGFEEAENDLKEKLDAFLGNSYDNKIFVMTGHSRGAAAVNILAAKLADSGVSKDKIYAYTFACPNVGTITKSKAAAYPMIFNIGNVNDMVSWVPGMGDKSNTDSAYWEKYGRSFWFAPDWDDWKNIHAKGDTLISSLTNYHLQNVYLDFLRQEKELEYYKDREATTLVINWAVNKRRDEVMQRMMPSYKKKTELVID
ncbi:MAG: hypothetical protein IJ589_11365 [Lachnospiraceae bacterium]|nr:hypothetical protein [Lachnospiraceae bacterium]